MFSLTVYSHNIDKTLCMGVVIQNGKRQCSRKKKFGHLCGLHNNKEKRYKKIEKILVIEQKNEKKILIKKKIERVFSNNLNEKSINEPIIYKTIFYKLMKLFLNVHTNIVYRENDSCLIEFGKYDIVENNIY